MGGEEEKMSADTTAKRNFCGLNGSSVSHGVDNGNAHEHKCFKLDNEHDS